MAEYLPICGFHGSRFMFGMVARASSESVVSSGLLLVASCVAEYLPICGFHGFRFKFGIVERSDTKVLQNGSVSFDGGQSSGYLYYCAW